MDGFSGFPDEYDSSVEFCTAPYACVQRPPGHGSLDPQRCGQEALARRILSLSLSLSLSP
jgi:hypothetical protein